MEPTVTGLEPATVPGIAVGSTASAAEQTSCSFAIDMEFSIYPRLFPLHEKGEAASRDIEMVGMDRNEERRIVRPRFNILKSRSENGADESGPLL